jgi:hypothetical protein
MLVGVTRSAHVILRLAIGAPRRLLNSLSPLRKTLVSDLEVKRVRLRRIKVLLVPQMGTELKRIGVLVCVYGGKK